jgi:hypothetical protein
MLENSCQPDEKRLLAETLLRGSDFGWVSVDPKAVIPRGIFSIPSPGSRGAFLDHQLSTHEADGIPAQRAPIGSIRILFPFLIRVLCFASPAIRTAQAHFTLSPGEPTIQKRGKNANQKNFHFPV